MLGTVRDLTDVSLPPLLAALAVMTGREELLDPDLAPEPGRRLEPHGGLDAAQQARARALCATALDALDADGPVGSVDDASLRRAMEFCLADTISDRTFAMLREE